MSGAPQKGSHPIHAPAGLRTLAAMVSLVMTFNVGMMLERMEGITAGHEELLTGIDRWLQGLERAKGAKR